MIGEILAMLLMDAGIELTRDKNAELRFTVEERPKVIVGVKKAEKEKEDIDLSQMSIDGIEDAPDEEKLAAALELMLGVVETMEGIVDKYKDQAGALTKAIIELESRISALELPVVKEE